MDINEAFPSKWLKASDLGGNQPTMTISDVKYEEVGDDGNKPVIFFEETDKGIVLNKTNATNISEKYGTKTEAWRGKKVILFTTWVDFNGKSVEAIRIRPANQFVSGLPNKGSINQPLEDGAGPRDFAPLDNDSPF